jgi:hypothetical protein
MHNVPAHPFILNLILVLILKFICALSDQVTFVLFNFFINATFELRAGP